MAKLDIDDGLYDDEVPKIYVLSDSRGETANTVVLAAASSTAGASRPSICSGLP